MGMSNTISQLSVFLENREGRLDEVLNVLAENEVNIVALSLADTSDYGMLRMIVSEPHKGRAALKEAGITAMLTDVVALRVPHATGFLKQSDAPDRGRGSECRIYVCICKRSGCCGGIKERRSGTGDRYFKGQRF